MPDSRYRGIVQRNHRSSTGLAKWPAASLTPALLASVAVIVGGCSMGDNMLTTIGMPDARSTTARPDGMLGASRAGGQAEHLTVSPQQQAYLDGLAAAGVQSSDQIMALSIGSYICQARAAKQPEQAVWDFVLPLVRNDVRDVHASAEAPEVDEVHTVTADYIRIATERLC